MFLSKIIQEWKKKGIITYFFSEKYIYIYRTKEMLP